MNWRALPTPWPQPRPDLTWTTQTRPVIAASGQVMTCGYRRGPATIRSRWRQGGYVAERFGWEAPDDPDDPSKRDGRDGIWRPRIDYGWEDPDAAADELEAEPDPDRPEQPDVLPGADRAVIDMRKIHGYSMNPDHPQNDGKAAAWAWLGYEVGDPAARESVGNELGARLLRELPETPASYARTTEWGDRYDTSTPLTGPNGREASIRVSWQVHADGTPPKMVTIWAESHTERGAARRDEGTME